MNANSLNWELCRSFLAILRAGSLSGAGRALGVSHPTIRRHLEELEAGFDAPLFVRSPSGLAPTELSLALRGAAEAMESSFEQMLRSATDSGREITGTVRITTSEVMGAEVLPPMLAKLKNEHPGLAFELDLDDGVVDVLRHEADIAVRMVRPVQAELSARRVANVPLGLFAHQCWVERYGAPTSIVELIQSRGLIGYDRAGSLIDALARRGIAATRRDFGFRSDSTLAQLSAMRAALGVLVCQIPIAARNEKLVRLLPGFGIELEIWLVTHPNLRGSRRVRECIDALALDLAKYSGRSSK